MMLITYVDMLRDVCDSAPRQEKNAESAPESTPCLQRSQVHRKGVLTVVGRRNRQASADLQLGTALAPPTWWLWEIQPEGASIILEAAAVDTLMLPCTPAFSSRGPRHPHIKRRAEQF